MTRTKRTALWQLSAIAAAAGLMGIAQAQATDAAPADTTASVLDPYAAQNARNGMDAQSDAVSADASMNASTETSADTSAAATPDQAALPAASAPSSQSQTIVVVPTTVDTAAMASKAWTTVAEEQELPVARAEVVSEAVYANKNGLIPRGELAAKNEDSGTAYVEQADHARIDRSTQMYMARYDSRLQQFTAQEQERLNQLALQEQQRQQQLAQQQQEQPAPQQP